MRSAGVPGTRQHRGEGADLGEGLAAADKQEAAAHTVTVAAAQDTSHRHTHEAAWVRSGFRCSSYSQSGGQVQVHGSGDGTRGPSRNRCARSATSARTAAVRRAVSDRKSTRLNSSHANISYAV